MKSRDGKSQREEKSRRERRAAGAEPSGQMRDEKVHAVVAWSTCRSQCTKHTMLGPLSEVEMSKKCTPLWREVHFQVKMHKTHQARTTFGSWDVEKVHAVVARSTFPSQNVQTPQLRSTFRSCDVEKAHAVVARSTFRSQHVKSTRDSDHFWTIWTLRCHFAWQAQGIVHLLKSEQNVSVLCHFQKRWQAWDIWRGSAKMHLA